MTIGSIVSIIVGAIVVIVGVIVGATAIGNGESGGTVVIVIALIIAAVFIISPIVYMNTESGKRALKDQQSNFGDGINRFVEVYDVNGELIKQYDGKFDVETSNANGAPYIVFDDENNKRHIIYYTTGTVIIDEK